MAPKKKVHRDQHGFAREAPKAFQYGEPKVSRPVLAKVGLDNPMAYARLAPSSARQFMGRGHDKLDGPTLTRLMELGFTAVEDIRTMTRMGVTFEEIEALQEIGIETAEDFERAHAAGITLSVAKQFIERGVPDLNAMIAMKKGNKVGAGTLTAYQKLEDFKAEDIERLKKAKVSAATVNACVRVGVKTVDGVLKIVAENISGDDIRILGLYPMDEALVLAKMAYNTGEAWKLVKAWRAVGVEDAAEMKEMNDRLYGDGPKAIQTLVGLLPDPPDAEEGEGPDWRPYKDALTAFRGVAEVEILMEAGADLELIDWFAGCDWPSRYGGSGDGWKADILKVAMTAFTPDEIKALVEQYPDRNFYHLWPSQLPYEHGTRTMSGARVTAVDRQRMLDSARLNVSHDVLLEYHSKGFDADQTAALITSGWHSSDAEIAVFGGYSFEEIVAQPFKEPEEDELNLDEIEAESGTSAVDPEDWDWDDDA